MGKRLLSLLIVLCLTVSSFPLSVLASEKPSNMEEESEQSNTAAYYVTEETDEILSTDSFTESYVAEESSVSSEKQSDEVGTDAVGGTETTDDSNFSDSSRESEELKSNLSVVTQEAFSDESADTVEKVSQISIIHFAEMNKEIVYQHMVCGSSEDEINFPVEINATITSGDDNSDVTIDGIKWEINSDESDFETYSSQYDGMIFVYNMVIPDGYSIADGVELPTITVVVGDLGLASPVVLSDAAENVEGFIAPVDDPDASAVKITTVDELAAISDNMYGSYVLMNDIDMSEYGNWSPIGKTLSGAFHGKFDGQGHTISGLSVSVSFDSGTLLAPCYAVGLFGICDGAQIKNVSLENVDISISTTSGYQYDNSIIDSEGTVFAGAIAGYVKNSTVIYNCIVSGSISASASGEGYSPSVAGGLVGYANTAIISYSYNLSSVTSYNGNAVTSENAYAGGLLGRAEVECIIDRSYNSGTVSSRTLDYGDSFAGGLVADTSASSTEITNSFNEGTVQGLAGNLFCDSAYAGGIAAAFQGSIDKVYNSGTVIAQAADPYGIDSTTAYAGGICGNTASASTISNSAVVQENVSATASGTKYQYRISNSGVKSNNVTVSSATAGSTNDADISRNLSELTVADVYANILGWDFTTIWEMVSGKDFPQLKQVDTSSEEYDHEYVEQHLDFINKGAYQDILNNYRWAQIYWSEENNFKSNLGGALYTGVDKLVDLANLKFGDLFEDGNPFKVMLADYISDQSVEESVAQLYKVKIPYELDKKYKAVKKYIKENWKDEWGELSDEDLFWLFHYEDRTSDEWINSGFEEHISEIVYGTRHEGEGLEKALGITTETLDEILEQKKHLDNTIDWFNGLITYSGHVAAYVQANEEFHSILEEMCNNLPATNVLEIKYKAQLYLALKSYTQYDDTEHLVARVFAYYLVDSGVSKFVDVIKKTINEKTTGWMKETFSAAALEKLNTIGWVADKTWKICEYVTKNGELQECREMLKANAYFEDTMYRTLLSIESQFKISQTFENACLFDAAFKFFKETEICSMDTVITYFDTYQTSWLQAIRNLSNTFMNSAIEEVQINKLFLYNTYCHGTSYTLGGKVITIACPTNVYIYDESGILVASIEDNVVTYCADYLLAYTADAVKLVTVPLDQNYSIKIDATDDGIMCYSISEYNSEKENVQTTVYSDVDVSKGGSFTGSINNEINTESESYNLSGNDDTVIDDFEIVTGETNVPVKSITITDSEEVISVRDTVSFAAEILPENATVKSVVWSSSDSDVISVSENGELTAVGEGSAIVSAQSVYGGATDFVEVIVVSDEHNLFITRQPQGAIYELGDQADALTVKWFDKNSDEEISFQWYAAEDETMDGQAIDGATEANYMPETDSLGTKYYYVEVSDSMETRTSERAVVSVISEQIIDSGSVNDDVLWELTESLLLRITGTGDLELSDSDSLPWINYRQLIQSVEIAEGIISIGNNVFNDMSQLRFLSIPVTVQTIEEGALSGCNALVELIIPFAGISRSETETANSVLGAVFGQVSSGGVAQYYSLSGTTLSGYRYGIPDTLKSVIITDATQLSFGTFYNCSGLEEIVLNEGVESINGYAFYNCSSLTQFTIPSTVTNIGTSILGNCTSICNLTIPYIGTSVDANNSSDATLGFLFGNSSDGIVQYYSQSGTSLSGGRYAIPAMLKEVTVTNADHIPFGAFSNCSNLTNITMNNGVEKINGYAFYNCTGIESIVIPDSVTGIEEYALNGCNSLKEISVPFIGSNRDANGTYDGVLGFIFGRTSESDSNYYVQYSVLNGTSLSGYGYAVPTALTKVVVTDAVQIPVGAFSNLTDLKYVTLNSGITEIGAYAFYNATGLTDIYYEDWDTEWEKINVGDGNTVLNNVTIHYLETMSKLIAASLRLTGDIGVNFYYQFTDEMLSDPSAKVLVTVGDGRTETFAIDDASIDQSSIPGKTLYKFTCYVKAKQMKDNILIQAVSDTKTDETYTYSIRKYADNIISGSKYSEELKYLVRVMMYYGSCSQLYLKYDTANLASSGLIMDDIIEKSDGLTPDDLAEYVVNVTDMPEGISIYAANLSLLSETVLRYHFKLNDGYDISNYTFTIAESEYSPILINGCYCIEITNIRAQDIDNMFTVTVTDKNGKIGTVTYGALTYVRNILNAGTSQYSQELIDTVRSLYLYNRAAESYVASKS